MLACLVGPSSVVGRYGIGSLAGELVSFLFALVPFGEMGGAGVNISMPRSSVACGAHAGEFSLTRT